MSVIFIALLSLAAAQWRGPTGPPVGVPRGPIRGPVGPAVIEPVIPAIVERPTVFGGAPVVGSPVVGPPVRGPAPYGPGYGMYGPGPIGVARETEVVAVQPGGFTEVVDGQVSGFTNPPTFSGTASSPWVDLPVKDSRGGR